MDRDAGMVTSDIDRSMASDELCGKICRWQIHRYIDGWMDG